MQGINTELFNLTYGAMVAQVIRDFEDPREINAQLEQMGYNIGVRLVDEFFAKTRGAPRCKTFRDAMEVIAKDAFRMFLGVSPILDAWSPDASACTLRLLDNPLADFVELPPAYAGELRYSNIIAGVLRGALEMISMRVEARFVKDVLNGDDTTELRVTLKDVLSDAAGKEYRDE